MKATLAFLFVGALFIVLPATRASSVIPLTPAENVQVSDAIFRGTVVGAACFKNSHGLIYTSTSLRVDEVLKGTFPAVVKVTHRGGTVGAEEEFSGFAPRFQMGGQYLMFVKRVPDGRLICTQGAPGAVPLPRVPSTSGATTGGVLTYGEELLNQVRQLTGGGKMPGADVTDQTGTVTVTPNVATGLLTNSAGLSSRFLEPDRGEPIPYLIDADSYPSALTLAQATNAVKDALAAWSAVSSLKFQFEGIQSFGEGADAIVTNDQKLRIQLHDLYNRINTTNVLGIGGRTSLSNSPPGTTWNLGGNVAGNEFMMTSRGYVVLEATNTAMNTLSTFTEVLCHEIGHALSMAHSSEDPDEPAGSVRRQSIMYYLVHADGRGATLGAYDPPVIEEAYPSNTPPFSFDRLMDVTTAPVAPGVAGINQVEMRGYDLQTTNLTLELTNGTSINGSFSRSGNTVSYTPSGYYGYSGRLNPTGTKYKDEIYARFSDGSNASPYVVARVVSFNPDQGFYPPPSDGLPNQWMSLYFGHDDPEAADKSQATDDADGDGLSNLQEYQAGSDPTDALSGQRIISASAGTLQFQAKAYELYEVLGSTNLTDWTRVGLPVVPTNAPIEVLTNSIGTNIIATVSNLPTAGPRMFFRILKVP